MKTKKTFFFGQNQILSNEEIKTKYRFSKEKTFLWGKINVFVKNQNYGSTFFTPKLFKKLL